MRVTQHDNWLNYLDVLIFAEGPKDPPKEDPPKEEPPNDDDKGDPPKDDKTPPEKEDVSGLKSALEKERSDRKALEKQIKELNKFKETIESKDKTESEKAKDEAAKSAEKVTKLATRLRSTALESAIAKAATKANFRDVDDAISLVKRDTITVEQDEDDPADIEIDEKSVEKAIKLLAEAKPHLLVAEGERTPSGSKMGGKGSKTEADEEALRKKYSSLRRGSPDR